MSHEQLWRVLDDGVRPAAAASALSSLTLDDALQAALVTLDSSNQGVPRSAGWLRRAIELIEQAEAADVAEAEELQVALEQEQQLTAQRRAVADTARSEYVQLKQQELRRPHVTTHTDPYGRTYGIAEQAPAPQPFALSESESRPGSSPQGRAYWRWQDREAEVAVGVEGDPRTIRVGDREVLRETLLTERLSWLRRLSGMRASRRHQLFEHLARLAELPPGPVVVILKDEAGREQRSVLTGAVASSALGGRPT